MKRGNYLHLIFIFLIFIFFKDTYAQQPGEILPEEFEAIVKKIPEDTILLDVRTKEEFAQGHIKGAINIPKDELEQRAIELPRDKRIIIYCSIGIRSEWAYGLLVNYLGFRDVTFLNRKISIDPDGNFKIFQTRGDEE